MKFRVLPRVTAMNISNGILFLGGVLFVASLLQKRVLIEYTGNAIVALLFIYVLMLIAHWKGYLHAQKRT